MKEVIPFNFEAQQIRVVKDEQGEPWFLGMDVCSVLGLVKVEQAYSRLDSDEKATLVRQVVGLNPGRPLTIVSESGLYKLILRSDKPQAKPFQNWVTQVVLPSIRKTGGYIAGEETMDEDELVLKAMQVLQRKLEEKQKVIEEQALQLSQQKPKVEAWEKYLTSEGTFTLEGLAKVLGFTAIKLCRQLREDGYLAKDRDAKGNFTNLPNKKSVEQGLFKVMPGTYTYSDKFGETHTVPYLTTRALPKAVEYFGKLYAVN